MKELLFFVVTCEEIDVFNGKVIHLNEKAKDLDEVHDIVLKNIKKYPNAEWNLYPNKIIC